MSSQAQPSIGKIEDKKSTKVPKPNPILHEFLFQREPVFPKLHELREKVILLPTVAGAKETKQ
jgi:hypothetical protein